MKTHRIREAFGYGEFLAASTGRRVASPLCCQGYLREAILLPSLPHGADFKALVAEWPYSSFEAIARERIARALSKGQVSSWTAKPSVNQAFFYTRLRYGINLNAADTAAAVEHAIVPILLIHGLADHETSPLNSKEIADRNRGFISLWLVPGVPYTGAFATAPSLFEQTVLHCFASRLIQTGNQQG